MAQKLAPGDKIRIVCDQEPSLGVERVIARDGTVSLPLLGSFYIAGRFVVEAEDDIRRSATQKLRVSDLRLSLTLVDNEFAPIEFLGAVNRSGIMPYKEGATFGDVLELANPNGSAKLEAVEIRSADGQVSLLDANDLSSLKAVLKPGDRVFFPKADGANEVYILGSVAKPGSRQFRAGMTLRELIDLGGGITGNALQDRIKITRPGAEPSYASIAPGAEEFKLERGDAVTVETAGKLRYVTVNGHVARPGSVAFREGMTLTEALKAAGGVSIFARIDRVSVRRVGETPYLTRIVDLQKVRAGQEEDMILRPADIVSVPMGQWRKVSESGKPVDEKPKRKPVVPPR